MRKLVMLVLLSLFAIVITACGSEDREAADEKLPDAPEEREIVEEVEEEPEEHEVEPEEEQEPEKDNAVVEVGEEEVYEILKSTLGELTTAVTEYVNATVSTKALNMSMYMEEYPDEFQQEFTAILDKGTTGAAKEKIYEKQVNLMDGDPHNFPILYYLNAEEISLPLEIVEQDSSNLVVSYYDYGRFDPYTAAFTRKVTLEFTKLEDTEKPWKLADYSVEDGIEELEFELTKELLEESYQLKGYLMDTEIPLTWETDKTVSNRDVFSLTVEGFPYIIDKVSGIVIVVDEYDPEPNIDQIIEMIKENNRMYEEYMKSLEAEEAQSAGEDLEDITVHYTITEDSTVEMDSEINSIHLKVGQKISLVPTLEGELTERVLVDVSLVEFLDEHTVQAIAEGTGTLTIIPNGYDWENAKEIEVVIE